MYDRAERECTISSRPASVALYLDRSGIVDLLEGFARCLFLGTEYWFRLLRSQFCGLDKKYQEMLRWRLFKNRGVIPRNVTSSFYVVELKENILFVLFMS